MTIAFVLGNGQSRQSLDLQMLKKHGPIYGCNALYRDFEPDCLVATDRPIAEAIQKSGYSKTHRFYTRKPIDGLGAQRVPKKYYGNSSGPIACSLACIDGHNRIYMLGYDMGATANSRFNNVYAGTEFYKAKDALPTFTGNWIKQLTAIANDFSTVEFIRVRGATTADIYQLQNLSNFRHISLDEFLNRINTKTL